MTPLRARQRLGKYKLVRRIADGGFATVYEALDTVLGVKVAVKIANQPPTSAHLTEFRKEAALHARLDHPGILSLSTADVVDGRLVVAHPLAERSLLDRLRYRLGTDTFALYARQMLEALAYAHGKGVIHCDIKPENFLLFEDNRLRLADFGISRLARGTVRASGSGTVGYIAPEQAMGRTSFRSDVFSLGLLLYEMLAGTLPEWPFRWPFPNHERVRRKVPESFVRFLRRATEVEPKKRFADGRSMLRAFQDVEEDLARFAVEKRRRAARRSTRTTTKAATKTATKKAASSRSAERRVPVGRASQNRKRGSR